MYISGWGGLIRLRVDRARRNIDDVALMLEIAVQPHLRNHVHGFVDLRRQILNFLTESAGFLLRAALADAEMQPALGQDIQCRDALGDLDRVVHREGQADHPVPDMNAAGLARDEGEETFRRGQMGILGQAMMLDRPDTVESQLFRQHALFDHVLEDLEFVGARGIDHLRFVNNREFH